MKIHFLIRAFSISLLCLLCACVSEYHTRPIQHGYIYGSLASHSLHPLKGIKARLERSGIQVLEYGDNIKIVIPSDAFFPPNSDKLNDQRRLNLADMVNWIRKTPAYKVDITAYTDNVGRKKFKKHLSERQAHRIAAFFWAHGISHTRMQVKGLGHKNAVASNRSTLGSSFNRRIEVHWLKKKLNSSKYS